MNNLINGLVKLYVMVWYNTVISQKIYTTFSENVFKVVDIMYVRKNDSTLVNKGQILLVLINKYGGVETCGIKCINHKLQSEVPGYDQWLTEQNW